MNPIWLNETIRRALNEDLGPGDLTSSAVIPPEATGRAVLIAKNPGRIAGLHVAIAVFQALDPHVKFSIHVPDGDDVEAGTPILTLAGRTAALLSAERVALNFLQHMSGIATATSQAVAAAAPFGVHIVDTRKTTPGLRPLEKEAVRLGGGRNHRFGLFDAVMLKENHIAAAGGIHAAVARVRGYIGHTVKVEVEVETLDQVAEAVDAGADIILLDNMDDSTLRAAVEEVQGRALLEASGGITLDRIAAVAECGVDMISIGWITHSAPALDISLLLD